MGVCSSVAAGFATEMYTPDVGPWITGDPSDLMDATQRPKGKLDL